MSTILVVDDRSINRKFLAALLDYAGHTVIEAVDGSQALAKVRSCRPDLIITDLMMPIMDGLEMTQRLRADPATADIPVAFYTATYRVQEAREIARSCGVDVVLSKPSSPHVILDAVAGILAAQAAKASAGAERDSTFDTQSAQTPLAAAGESAPQTGARGRRLTEFHSLSMRLAALLELSLTLGAERDRRHLLDMFCHAARDIIGTNYAGVVMFDTVRGAVREFSASGLDEKARADLAEIDRDRGFMADLMGSNETICRAMLNGDATRAGLPPSHPPIQTMLAVRTSSPAESVRGVLYLADKINGEPFDEDDEQLAATLAAQLALTYGNLKLYDDMQRHAGELQMEVVERKRTAEILRDSEVRYRHLFDANPLPMWVYDLQTLAFLAVNDAAVDRYGYSRDEFMTMTIADIRPEQDLAALKDNMQESVHVGNADIQHAGVWRHRKRNGEIIEVDISSHPIDFSGRSAKLVLATDVTQRNRAEKALRASEHEQRRLAQQLEVERLRLVSAQQVAKIGSWDTDVATMAVIWSDETHRIFETDRTTFHPTHQDFLQRVHPDDRADVADAFTNSLAQRTASAIQHRILLPGGRIKSVEERWQVFFDEHARPIRAVGTCQDITERKEQERKIARLNRIRAVIGGISSAMLRLVDRDALLQEACRVATTEGVFPLAWISMFDAQTGRFEVKTWHGEDPRGVDLLLKLTERGTWPAADRPSYRAAQAKRPVAINDVATDPRMALVRDDLLRYGYRSIAAFPLLSDGNVLAVLMLLARERDFFDAEEIDLLAWLAADLSFALNNIQKSNRLDYLLSYDALTGLPNVRLFKDRLEQLILAAAQNQCKLCVVVVDLERFTHINETLGRSVGDALLREVGSRFAEFLVEPYTLGRIGDDNFAAASQNDSEFIATKLRDRMFDALKLPFIVDGHEVRITAKAGIALFPTDGHDSDSVLRNAEAALGFAKSSGQRYMYYSSDMNTQIAQRLALEEQLRAAVDAQQFVLHYQPRVDMISGEFVGAEALIRWQHPDRGLLAPADFIVLAEETGLIVPIGAWAIHAVCAQQAAWTAAGLDCVPVAVNLSSVQFEQDDLLQTVSNALAANSLNAKLLDLELTESTVMNDAAAAAKTLQALRTLGVGLAMDDFGTGYSSLALLKRFPFHSVKIDRSFVADITRNAEDAAIAMAIIALAHSLNLKVVAEGVETQGQFNYLRAHGCDEMQGNFFSPAVAREAFEAQLRSGKRITLPAPASADERTLLLVDDEPGICASLKRMLRPDGYRILTASSGQEGLELLALNPVQVIISDQRMPGMSGTEFLSTVKQLYPDTVRIILSGYTDLAVVTEAVNLGSVFKFLTKPWNDNLLRDQVRDAFRRYQATASH